VAYLRIVAIPMTSNPSSASYDLPDTQSTQVHDSSDIARGGPTRRPSFRRIVPAHSLPVAKPGSLTIRHVVPVHGKELWIHEQTRGCLTGNATYARIDTFARSR